MRLSEISAAFAAFMLAAPAAADRLPAVRSEQGDASLHVEVVDITPRFLAFYDAARGVADPAARFALWQEHYGFAAVPPGPRGEEMARRLLDQGWSRYEAGLPTIRLGAAAFGSDPIDTLRAIARLLEADRPLNVRLVAYVGAFDGNAFTAGAGGAPTVNFPVEMDAEARRPIMAHEFTHAVHIQLAGLSGGWERSIAETLMQEGLAVHTSREVVPGRPLTAYIEHQPGWWARAGERKAAILRGILPALESKDGETVFRFTMGTGPGGIDREAYAAGYWVVEQLRAEGMTLGQIARIGEADMARVARGAIERMLAAQG